MTEITWYTGTNPLMLCDSVISLKELGHSVIEKMASILMMRKFTSHTSLSSLVELSNVIYLRCIFSIVLQCKIKCQNL